MSESNIKININGDLISFYTEIVKINDIDTNEKLKSYIQEFIESKTGEDTWLIDSLNLTCDTDNEFKYETKAISNPINIIPNAEDNEIVFQNVFVFRNALYTMQIDKSIPLILETFKLDDEEFILDFSQNNIKIEQDVVEITNDDCENYIGFYIKNKKYKTINLFDLYKEVEDDINIAIERISTIIYDYIKEKDID
jgi:hypothetical protein